MKVRCAVSMHKLGNHMYDISNVRYSHGEILQSSNHASIFCRISKQLAISESERERERGSEKHAKQVKDIFML